MPYTADPSCSPEQWNTVLANQESTLKDNIQQDIALESVYTNTIAGGTHDGANMGEDIRTLLQNRASPAWSRTAPEFQRATEVCAGRPTADRMGQTEYTTRMETLLGESPTICVRNSVHLVKNSLTAAYTAMKQSIVELKDYDIRNQYNIRSGVKLNVNSTLGTAGLTGDKKAVATKFNTSVLPDSAMSYKALIWLAQYARTVLGVTPFGSGADSHALVIAGFEQVEAFLQEAGVMGAILAQTQGGYADGNDAIKRLMWTDIQHRGLKLNVDYEPLRFNDWDEATGLPACISPTVETASDHGVDSVTNPAWLTAKFEVGFMVFRNAFRYLVPKPYVGEGPWKFAPQYVTGDLVWHNVKDNGCNIRGDTGFFIYEVTRAIETLSPHSVIPFAYKRCAVDLGLTACDDYSISS